MKSFKNKYLILLFSIVIIIVVYLFFFFVKKGLHKPPVIDKPVEEDVEIPEIVSSGSRKESRKTAQRFILNLDDLEAIKNPEQQPRKKVAPGVRQDTIQEDSIMDTLRKRDEGTTLYKKGRIKIKGKAGFSELPEKDDSLDELMDKSEIKGNIGVEF